MKRGCFISCTEGGLQIAPHGSLQAEAEVFFIKLTGPLWKPYRISKRGKFKTKFLAVRQFISPREGGLIVCRKDGAARHSQILYIKYLHCQFTPAMQTRAELKGDTPKVTEPNLRFPRDSCENLRFSARICSFLRFPAPLKNAGISRTGGESAKICGFLCEKVWVLGRSVTLVLSP